MNSEQQSDQGQLNVINQQNTLAECYRAQGKYRDAETLDQLPPEVIALAQSAGLGELDTGQHPGEEHIHKVKDKSKRYHSFFLSLTTSLSLIRLSFST